MEQGASSFGNVVEYLSDSSRSVIYHSTILARSATRPTPEIVQIFTDAPLLK